MKSNLQQGNQKIRHDTAGICALKNISKLSVSGICGGRAPAGIVRDMLWELL